MKTIYIYILKDPISNDIRYVGKAVDTKKRFNKHLRDSKVKTYHSAVWIKSLLNKGLKPIMEVIEEANESNWEEREKYWIDFYKTKFDLTNINEGGGFGGVTYGFKGKTHSKESIDKMKKARTGVSIKQNDKDGNRKKSLRAFFDKNKKPVVQYDLNGEKIKEWESAVDAGTELGLPHSNITKTCKGLRKKCGGFKWKYKHETINII